MTFIGRYNTHYIKLMDTVTACKSGTGKRQRIFILPLSGSAVVNGLQKEQSHTYDQIRSQWRNSSHSLPLW